MVFYATMYYVVCSHGQCSKIGRPCAHKQSPLFGGPDWDPASAFILLSCACDSIRAQPTQKRPRIAIQPSSSPRRGNMVTFCASCGLALVADCLGAVRSYLVNASTLSAASSTACADGRDTEHAIPRGKRKRTYQHRPLAMAREIDTYRVSQWSWRRVLPVGPQD